MKTLTFDVMLHDRYVCTLQYRYNPAFAIVDSELVDFVIQQRPSLTNKNFKIAF